MASTNIDPTTLRQIENVVSDLRNSEYQSFGKHLKKLSRLLHSPELEPATARLIKDIDLEGWLKAGEDTQGGMIGSAKLEWPSEHEKELGTVVLLIDRFADNPDEALIAIFIFDTNPPIPAYCLSPEGESPGSAPF